MDSEYWGEEGSEKDASSRYDKHNRRCHSLDDERPKELILKTSIGGGVVFQFRFHVKMHLETEIDDDGVVETDDGDTLHQKTHILPAKRSVRVLKHFQVF